MRKKLVIGNWKMNLNLQEVQDLVLRLKNQLTAKHTIEIAVCPSFVYLVPVLNILKDSKEPHIKVGAQNLFHKDEGAFTGEISPKMLKDLKVEMVIIGHSERRQHFYETNHEVNLKIKSSLKYDLTPVLCVGEDLKTREAGYAENFVKEQLKESIKNLTENDLLKTVIAYEPIWAIGTGKICSGEDANKIIKMIRNTIKDKYTNKISESIKILYGGSIKSDNFHEHIGYPDIDGGLVGGASLKFEEFYKIIELANTAHSQCQSHLA